MALRFTRQIGTFPNGNRIVLSENTTTKTWDFSLQSSLSSGGFAMVNAGEGFRAKEAAQSAAISAIEKIPDEELRKGFHGMIQWQTFHIPHSRPKNAALEELLLKTSEARRRDFLSVYTRLLSVATMLVGLGAGLWFTYQTTHERVGPDDLRARVSELQQEVKAVQSTFSTAPQTAPDLTAIQVQLNSLEKRIDGFEQITGDNAIKSMSVVVLRNDIDNLNRRIDSVRDEFNRFLAMLAFIAALISAPGILSLFTSFRNQRTKQNA